MNDPRPIIAYSLPEPPPRLYFGLIYAGALLGGGFGMVLLMIGYLVEKQQWNAPILLSITASPFSVIRHQLGLACLVSLIFWTCVGGLIASAYRRGPRMALLILLAAHYGLIPLVLYRATEGEWKLLISLTSMQAMGVTMYALGQLPLLFVISRLYFGPQHLDD